jgi:DNA-binding NarL/FixJ family response regulator
VAWSVLIVDDHSGFRAGARALLEADGFDVVGEAADGRSAIERARELRPDVVLLDVQLPGMDGFAVAELLAAEPTAPVVVLVSSRSPGTFRARLADSPARGFITKAEFSGESLNLVLR